ncbi:MAG: YceI family protein [Acidobacteria bacterium]|uniref:YceI family protein n=1 Tax=Candidatus Polarisedimenticola svalbardensis TaxID=2886004 RepID=A0A8J6XZV4_9BACT|nr:YceI family protein [Candidatus Polarisedimenticola svalbardensis]
MNTRKTAILTLLMLLLVSTGSAFAAETTYHFGSSPQNTNVTFESETDFETILGSTREIKGKAVVDLAAGTASTTIEVPVESLRTGIDLRDKHLRSGMWLDAGKHPSISFVSSSAKKIDDTKWEITGTFSMHGESRELTTVVEVRPIPEEVAKGAGLGKGDWIRIVAPFEVKLSDFGVQIPKKPAQRVNDTWKVRVQAFATTAG